MPANPDIKPEDILKFWFEDSKPMQWFKKDAAFDDLIRSRFGLALDQAMDGKYDGWQDKAQSMLALIILLDQFPRNLFREDKQAFASDDKARGVLRAGLEKGFDQALTQQQRNFFYLPLEHSEKLEDQLKSVDLFRANGDETTLDYAIRHLKIIEQFGRFPHRNKAVGRASSEEEKSFLTQDGSSF